MYSVAVVQPLIRVPLFATSWAAARQASLSFTNSGKLAQTHVHGLGDAIQQSHSLSSPSIFLSNRVFSNGSVPHIRWPKHWSFILSICPSNEYSGLISFRINWLDLLAVQGTPTLQLKSINSLALSFLHSPTLTSLQDYWKNQSLD